MSLSVSGSVPPQKDFSYDADAIRSSAAAKPAQTISKHDRTPATPPPPAKPTEEQQLQQLVALGDSNQQIATALGLTVTQVEQSLAGTSTASSTASAVVALAGRLSVKV